MKIIIAGMLMFGCVLPLMGEDNGDVEKTPKPTGDTVVQDITLKDGRKIEGWYDKRTNQIVLLNPKTGKAIGKIVVKPDDIVSVVDREPAKGNVVVPKNGDEVGVATGIVAVESGSACVFTYPFSSIIDTKCDPNIGSFVRIRSTKVKMSLQITSIAEPDPNKKTDQAWVNTLVEQIGHAQYEATSVEKKTVAQPLKIAGGFGAIVSYTDALLMGKVLKPTQYLCVSTGCLYVGKTMMTVTLLTDSFDGPEYQEGLQILESVTKAEDFADREIVPGESWIVMYSGSRPSRTKGAHSDGGYEYHSSSEDGVIISMFVESPTGKAVNNEAVANFCWDKASKNPIVDPKSIKKTNETNYYRIEYTTGIDPTMKDATFKNVNYYFIKNGKWVDLHVSFSCEVAKQEEYLRKFEADLLIKDGKLGK